MTVAGEERSLDISIGLPTAVPRARSASVLDVARRADQAGFAGLGVVDRLVYDNYEPLTVLAAAAAVTERVRLTTTVLLAAYRGSSAVLAKQLATIDRIGSGRLVVGLAAGGRADDFHVAGASFGRRGRRLDEITRELRATWTNARIGPRPPAGGPPLLFGGHSDAAMRRAARHGSGWIAGAGSSTGFRSLVARVRRIWAEEGRTGRPRVVSLGYVCLEPDGANRAADHLLRYYPDSSKGRAVLAHAITTERGLDAVVHDYAADGCDELVLFPCTADPEQVDRIAEVVL